METLDMISGEGLNKVFEQIRLKGEVSAYRPARFITRPIVLNREPFNTKQINSDIVPEIDTNKKLLTELPFPKKNVSKKLRTVGVGTELSEPVARIKNTRTKTIGTSVKSQISTEVSPSSVVPKKTVKLGQQQQFLDKTVEPFKNSYSNTSFSKPVTNNDTTQPSLNQISPKINLLNENIKVNFLKEKTANYDNETKLSMNRETLVKSGEKFQEKINNREVEGCHNIENGHLHSPLQSHNLDHLHSSLQGHNLMNHIDNVSKTSNKKVQTLKVFSSTHNKKIQTILHQNKASKLVQTNLLKRKINRKVQTPFTKIPYNISLSKTYKKSYEQDTLPKSMSRKIDDVADIVNLLNDNVTNLSSYIRKHTKKNKYPNRKSLRRYKNLLSIEDTIRDCMSLLKKCKFMYDFHQPIDDPVVYASFETLNKVKKEELPSHILLNVQIPIKSIKNNNNLLPNEDFRNDNKQNKDNLTSKLLTTSKQNLLTQNDHRSTLVDESSNNDLSMKGDNLTSELLITSKKNLLTQSLNDHISPLKTSRRPFVTPNYSPLKSKKTFSPNFSLSRLSFDSLTNSDLHFEKVTHSNFKHDDIIPILKTDTRNKSNNGKNIIRETVPTVGSIMRPNFSTPFV